MIFMNQMDQGGEYICEAIGYSQRPDSRVTVFLTVEKRKCY